MDEFKPEDELKPDTSDRRPTRSRKASSAPKVPISRQHMMMGIGILVLLLLVIGIGSALKAPSDSEQKTQPPVANNTGNTGNTTGNAGSEKSIDLSGSPSMSGQPTGVQPGQETAANVPTSDAASTPAGQQELSAPPISSTPTQAPAIEAPANQQRVELPGDLNNALSSEQGQVDAAAQGANNNAGSLPTAPATVAGGVENTRPVSKPVQHQASNSASRPAKTTAHHPAASKPAAASKPTANERNKPTATTSQSSAKSTPGGNYTLQLSSASRSDTLNAWAKKQNLSGYHVYKTTRNGQPWYVLVTGSYGTPAEAKRAVGALPAEVRAQSPWVKPVSQVKKESVN
nr:SPOR domain-containing protein [Pantoea sp. 201603H]